MIGEVAADIIPVTRSHKLNDRDHVGLADGTALPEEHLPRYFAKSGHADTDRNKVKKDGSGKGNWGRSGDEVQDYAYNLHNPRRRSNSSSHGPGLKDFKSKFEMHDPEPVFEEALHGPVLGDDHEYDDSEKDLADSMSGGSIQEEEIAKKV